MNGTLTPLSLYLHPLLAQHRRGRLLVSLTQAQGYADTLPERGVILAIGQDIQNSEPGETAKLMEWCQRAGRTLLLLPPFAQGPIIENLDWSINYRDTPDPREAGSLSKLLAAEVTLSLLGQDGSFEQTADYLWKDDSPFTRYWKKHSGTGAFAATTLPLWSISLLGQGEALGSWIDKIHSHAGKFTPTDTPPHPAPETVTLEPVDYTTMVCLYGWSNSSHKALVEKITNSTLFNLPPETLTASLHRLGQLGYLQEGRESTMLSAKGLQVLQASPYIGYAESLLAEQTRTQRSGSDA